MSQFVQTPLWKHQREELDRLNKQGRILLGWDMGTGKTLAAIERDLTMRHHFKKQWRTLCVVPLQTFEQWAEAWQREAPQLKVRVLDPKHRGRLLAEDADVFIVHWQALALMPSLRGRFHHGIFDEVQFMKKTKAKMAKAAKQLGIKMLTDMSGTPADNNPIDLFSILQHLKPNTYSSINRFKANYLVTDNVVVWKTNSEGKKVKVTYTQTLGPSEAWFTEGMEHLKPFYSRVLVDDVLDLPPYVRNTVRVDLHPAQRRAYLELEKDFLTWVRDEVTTELYPLMATVIIAQWQRLQQFALGTMIWNSEKEKFGMAYPAPKLDMVLELLELAPTEQFVVWSQFKAPLALLASTLTSMGISNVLYTGDVKRKGEKASNRQSFMAGDARVLLATIRSAGTGLDGLQHAARRAIFLDRDWMPGSNQQAETRLRRGGQTKTVFITDIEARDSIDQLRLEDIEVKGVRLEEMLSGRKLL